MIRKKDWAEFFEFSRRDRLAVLVLVLLITGVSLLPRFFGHQKPFSIQELRLDTLPDSLAHPILAATPENRTEQAEVFDFDPNQIGLEDWKRLGLPERTARTILNYRSKGGSFRHPEDLQKIWSLPAGFYERVKDHIRITAASRGVKPMKEAPRRFAPPAPIGINSADSAAWEGLPGIGSRLAARIVSFRLKLGGFYSVEQLKEVYGLPDSSYQKILPFLQEDGAITKLDLNKATREELAAHPYIRYKLANALIAYREQHGSFKNTDELKKFESIAGENWGKMLRYLVVEPKALQ